MPSCKKVESLLSSYFDGELDSHARHQVEEHLKDCAHCREQLEAIRAMSRAFEEFDVLEVTDEFRDRLHLSLTAAAREQKAQADTRATWYSRLPRWLFDWRTFSAAAACLLLVVVAGTGAFKNYSAPTPQAPVATSVTYTAQPTSTPLPDTTTQVADVPSQPQLDTPQPTSEIKPKDVSESVPQQKAVLESAAEVTSQPNLPSGDAYSQQVPTPPTVVPLPTGTPAVATPTPAPNLPSVPSPTVSPNEPQPSISAKGGSPSISAYGIGQTTLYFQAADEAALQTAAQIAEGYGEVTCVSGKVIIKLPNENLDAFLSELYSTQGISQTGTDFEPIAQSDPKVNDALDFVYIVISLP